MVLVALRRALARSVLAALFAIALPACAEGGTPFLLPIERTEVAVHEVLRLPIEVNNPNGRPLVYTFEAPELPALASTISISGAPTGGELRWTPLASHVGEHVITVRIGAPGGQVYDEERAIVVVRPAADAAPVFLSPGAGGTYDMSRDPCVRFVVEVRDDDSPSVDLRERSALPDGAALISAGPKSADFEWCPTRDQIAAAERWTIELSADDGDHEPVPHDYVVVLRTGSTMGCPGDPPSIEVVSPRSGERITSGSGYDVVVRVTDDFGLRDAPLLYWTTEAPDDPSMPDVTTFEQVVFEADGEQWRARVPSMGLAEGAEREIFYTVSATDNDDASGSICDHRADLVPVVSFYAVGVGGTTGTLGQCAPCTASAECASGVCAPAAGGPRCLTGCATTACTVGTCGARTTLEGTTSQACGDVAAVCGGSMPMCTDDGREDDDTIAMASMPGDSVSDGRICAGDTDYFRIDGAFRELVTVTVDGFRHSEGDLDLRLLDSAGTILASSASTSDSESAEHCMGDGGRVYAQVLGYRMAEGGYSLRVTRMAGACCADDAGEPDDSAPTARRIEGAAFEGTVCPGDDDYIAVPIAGASRVEITLVFDGGIGDVDLELYAPGASTPLARSTGTGDMESISATVATAGTYAIRVYGYSMAANTYLGEVTVTPTATCTLSRECPAGQVCASGACRSDDCTAMAMCPPMHLCPDVGPGTATSDCGAICTVNTDCRTTEACKWFPEGRACGTRGTGLNGDGCASFRECGGQRACVDWPGGYCARAGCRTNADCETGTWCVAVGGQNVCTLDCLLSDDLCRLDEGYACDFVADVSGSSHFACVPE